MITVLRPAWYGALGREVVIAEAARYYAGELGHLVSGGSPSGPTPSVNIELSTVPPAPKSLDDLVATVRGARSVKPVGFEDDACAGARYKASLSIAALTLEQEIAEATESAVTVGPAVADARLGVLVRELEALSLDVRSELSRLAPSIALARRRLVAIMTALFPRSPVERARSFVIGPAKLIARFRWALTAWREAHDREARMRVRADALEQAAARARAAQESVRALVDRVRSVLTDLAGPARPALFFFAPLSETSPEMVRCIMRGDISLLKSLLARSARQTTIEGLARLTNAAQASPAEVAARLLGPPLFQGPFWGGADPGGVPFLRAIVLPPVGAALARQVREAAEQAGLRQEFVIGDTLAGGAAVVALEVYEVTSEVELFTPPYLCALRQVVGRDRELYPLSRGAREIAQSLIGKGAICGS
jgi:hypothetical protein